MRYVKFVIIVTNLFSEITEHCVMKNLVFSTAIAALSLVTMSCTSSSNTVQNQSNNLSETTLTENSTSDSTKPQTAGKSIIIDVRTQGEWDNDGHAPCSKLIPLDQLEQRVAELRGYEKITVVCRSGGRAGRAKQFLESQGFADVTNAGPWQNAACE